MLRSREPNIMQTTSRRDQTTETLCKVNPKRWLFRSSCAAFGTNHGREWVNLPVSTTSILATLFRRTFSSHTEYLDLTCSWWFPDAPRSKLASRRYGLQKKCRFAQLLILCLQNSSNVVEHFAATSLLQWQTLLCSWRWICLPRL